MPQAPRISACLLAAIACASASAAGGPAEGRPLPVTVTVVERPEADSWRVTYDFASPVSEVVFQRRRGPDRAERWRLAGEHLSWRTAGDEESIRVAGEAVREIALDFDSDFRPLVKQYSLNLSYTDGGRLLHTGLLSVRLPGAEGPPDHLWRFRTQQGRNIALLDLQAVAGLDWPESAASTGNGTYVYFGPMEVERAERAGYLADPGLPGWMRAEIQTRLPRLFDRYAGITGVELDFRPLIFLSYRPSDVSGLVFKGGTLDGLVQIAAEGRAWSEQTPEASFLWLERTAHEIFHFWTGEMFETVLDGDEAWLTEGGADHHALLMAAELGLLDGAGWRRRMVERANDCLVGLAGRPILGASERGDFRRLYTCGSTLWLWASAAARSASDDGDEHAFVRALLAAAEAGQLTTYGFLETLHRATEGHRSVAPYARLLFHGVPSRADELFEARMRAAGFDVELVPPERATVGSRTRLPEVPEGSWSRLLALAAGSP